MTRLNEKPVLILTAKSLSANRGPNSQYWQPPSPPAHPRSPSTPKLPHTPEIVVFQTRIPCILNPQTHCGFLVTHSPQSSPTKRNQGGACIVSVTADVCRRFPTPHSPHNPAELTTEVLQRVFNQMIHSLNGNCVPKFEPECNVA